jgi:hypothetical protein
MELESSTMPLSRPLADRGYVATALLSTPLVDVIDVVPDGPLYQTDGYQLLSLVDNKIDLFQVPIPDFRKADETVAATGDFWSGSFDDGTLQIVPPPLGGAFRPDPDRGRL